MNLKNIRTLRWKKVWMKGFLGYSLNWSGGGHSLGCWWSHFRIKIQWKESRFLLLYIIFHLQPYSPSYWILGYAYYPFTLSRYEYSTSAFSLFLVPFLLHVPWGKVGCFIGAFSSTFYFVFTLQMVHLYIMIRKVNYISFESDKS